MYKNLLEKYGITEEEIKAAVDQINFGKIACGRYKHADDDYPDEIDDDSGEDK